MFSRGLFNTICLLQDVFWQAVSSFIIWMEFKKLHYYATLHHHCQNLSTTQQTSRMPCSSVDVHANPSAAIMINELVCLPTRKQSTMMLTNCLYCQWRGSSARWSEKRRWMWKNSRHCLVIESNITKLNSSSRIDFTFNYLFLCDNHNLLFIERKRCYKNHQTKAQKEFYEPGWAIKSKSFKAPSKFAVTLIAWKHQRACRFATRFDVSVIISILRVSHQKVIIWALYRLSEGDSWTWMALDANWSDKTQNENKLRLLIEFKTESICFQQRRLY